jgi:hypothetical protein
MIASSLDWTGRQIWADHLAFADDSVWNITATNTKEYKMNNKVYLSVFMLHVSKYDIMNSEVLRISHKHLSNV